MTSTAELSTPVVSAPKSRLVTRPLLLRFVSILGSLSSLFLLLSVIPLFAEQHAGAGAAGAATTALMAATVVGELVTPWLVARCGYRLVLAGGLVLLGGASFGFLVGDGMVAIVVICLLRGLGFAAAIVAGGALTVALLPADRRGEGLALVGLVSGLPSVLCLPLGVWLAAHFGYPPVIIAAGVAALAAAASVPGLPDRVGTGTGDRPVGVIAGLRNGSLARPAVLFALTAVATGIVVTFLPLAVSGSDVVSNALLLQALGATAARMAVGRYGDRHGPERMMLPGLLISAAGMVVLADRTPVLVLAGAALFGVGFGVMQNATLSVMYNRVSEASYGAVSAIWNLAYDGGMGAGVAGFGFVAGRTGYPLAFCVTAAAILAGLVVWSTDRRRPVSPFSNLGDADA